MRASSVEIARGAVLAGRYQIEAAIGKGGSGIVLRAFDRVAQVPVAIKILKPELATDPRWVERFSRELRLARQIQHPNVCRVFDIGQADGHWFITMELATGGTLRDQMGEHAASRAFDDKLADVRAVVAGLAAIHEAGIVHRDVKPDNFLRMEDGRLVLSDFGLATNPSDAPIVSIMVGTPHYMAPEVVMGEPATKASDVWSAAVVIHEIVSGLRPPRTFKSGELRASQLGATKSDRALLGPCIEALDSDPARRPADGGALKTALELGLEHPRPPRRSPSRRASVLWGATIVSLAMATVVLARHLWRPADASSVRDALPAEVQSAGAPSDWSRGARVVADIKGRVHCFNLLPGGQVARVIWGSPRRAEDIDLGTGTRTPSALRRETYQVDCPVVSPNGERLLYTTQPSGASPEIMQGESDGSNAAPVTTGTSPEWLASGEEFVFNLSDTHLGIFSLSTMKYDLLAEAREQTREHLYKKAVNARGDLVAVTFQGEGMGRTLEVHTVPDLRVLGRWRIPNSIRDLQFVNGSLFLANVAEPGAFERLDLQTGVSHRVGALPSRVIRQAMALPSDEHLLVSTTRTSDAWLFEPGERPRRLTSDGRDYAASRSATGAVLVERQLADGRVVIFLYDRAGRATQVTQGPADGVPSFAGRDDAWVYSDYERKTIMKCTAGSCAELLRRDRLLEFPTMSPDDRNIAFVTPFGVPHVHVVDQAGQAERDLGPTALECPPVWTSPRSLWVFSGAGDSRKWIEVDISNGRRTGRSKDATGFNADEQTCGWEAEPVDSAFYQRVRIVSEEDWQAARVKDLPGLD